MVDVFTKEKRSWVMGRIRSTNTKMENLLEKKLLENRIDFEKYPKVLGKPDFLLKDKKVVVFVDGCFWHKCPTCYRPPKTRKSFWLPKIRKNVKRDKEVTEKLKEEGYTVVRLWEHQVENDVDGCLKLIREALYTQPSPQAK